MSCSTFDRVAGEGVKDVERTGAGGAGEEVVGGCVERTGACDERRAKRQVSRECSECEATN